MTHYKPFVGGMWYETEQAVTVRNPFDQTAVNSIGLVDAAGMEAAIEAAEKGFRLTRGMERYRRAEILEAMARGVLARREAFTNTISAECGKPRQLASVEVDRAAELFRFAAHACLTQRGESILPSLTEDQTGFYGVTQRFPVGPTAVIGSFNFPLSGLVHKLAPAVATGVSLVVKPASLAPAAALLLAEVAMEARVPAGAYNVVPTDHDTALRLVSDERIRLLFFAGRPETAGELRSLAGHKRLALEPGGHAVAVVEPDADLNFALPRIAAGAFAFAGQTMNSLQHILVHKSIYEEVEQHLLDLTEKKMRTGNPAEMGVVVGPMITTAAADRVMDWLLDATERGATLLTGGERRGNLIQPTLLADATRGQTVASHRVPGPVALLGSYETFSQAISEVNRTARRLHVGVFTHDINRAFRAFQEMEVGTVTVNDFPPLRFDHMPNGGTYESGCGRQGLQWAMDAMTEPRLLVLNLT